MKRALYIGVFDPITLGHLDILERAFTLVDELVIGVVQMPIPNAIVGMEERMYLVRKAVSHLKHIQVVPYDGRLLEMIESYQIDVIIKGLRMMSEFESEMNLVHTNYSLNYKVETIFLSTCEEYSSFRASLVRQIAQNHGGIEPFLPESIIDDVKSRYA